jgi:hypothetical protein
VLSPSGFVADTGFTSLGVSALPSHVLLNSRASVSQELGAITVLEIDELTRREAKEFFYKHTGRAHVDAPEVVR